MSSYSDWKRGYLTDEEYRSSYAKEQWEQDHPYEDAPFYTDDPDDRHWRCQNCGHCKRFNARRPVVVFTSYVDDKGYVHNNPEQPHSSRNYYARWSFDDEYIPGKICMLTHNQVMDDDYCEEFIEKKEDSYNGECKNG